MLQRQIVTWVLGTMKHGMVKQIIVEILWELASRTDNTLDDKMVEMVGDALGVDIN